MAMGLNKKSGFPASSLEGVNLFKQVGFVPQILETGPGQL